MSRKLLPSISSISSTAMANLNRMTFLTSISEITPNLLLSGQMAATVEQVQKLGISYILNVAIESSPIAYPKHVKIEKYDIIDFPTAPISSFFSSLTDKIHTHLNASKHNKVLVHCMAGISRSTTIVCAYLMRYMNLTLREAYLLCKKNRPICFPNLGFWSQLIAYEYQLKKENSVKMISTPFGSVPDIAYEEIKQLRAQQQLSTLPLSTASLMSTTSNTTNSSSGNTDTGTNQTRTTVREISQNNANSVARTRSLASSTHNRPSIVAATTHINNSIYQTPLFNNHKQTLVGPRFGVNRSLSHSGSNNNHNNHNHNNIHNNNHNNNSPSPGLSASSTSHASNRTFMINGATHGKHRQTNNHRHHPPTISINAAATTLHAGEQRSAFETTYRTSFFKPLVP